MVVCYNGLLAKQIFTRAHKGSLTTMNSDVCKSIATTNYLKKYNQTNQNRSLHLLTSRAAPLDAPPFTIPGRVCPLAWAAGGEAITGICQLVSEVGDNMWVNDQGPCKTIHLEPCVMVFTKYRRSSSVAYTFQSRERNTTASCFGSTPFQKGSRWIDERERMEREQSNFIGLFFVELVSGFDFI